jgi:phosphatidylglycerophosphate synthase
MKWDEYYEIVVPEEIREREAKKNKVVRFNRWVSSRIGYILHFTPVTGNMISFFRILMVFVATYLFSLLDQEEHLLALIGVSIMALQLNADGVDGALARIRGESSFFGDRIDNFGVDYGVVTTIIVISYLTNSKLLLLLGGLSIYIIVTFRQHVGLVVPHNIFMLFRTFFYTPIILVLIPTIMIFLAFMGLSVELLSKIVAILYLFLAILWLIVCSWIHLVSKDKDKHNSVYGKH